MNTHEIRAKKKPAFTVFMQALTGISLSDTIINPEF